MSLSRHFPQSTQAILAAQTTPPSRKRTLPRDHSIIVISSSPEEPAIPSPKALFDSEDEQYFGPHRTRTSISPPPSKPRKRCSWENDNSIEVFEDEDFTRLLGEFKYKDPAPLSDALNLPRPIPSMTRKQNLDGFFQEKKPPSRSNKEDPKPTKSRVKTTLTTRVALPFKPTKPVEKEIPSKVTVLEQQTSFFTTWAAAQAPTTRPTKTAAKPRRKPTKKKSNVEVVLLSPRTAQKSVRTYVGEVERGRLGEKTDGGLFDACKRGLEGELYDGDGGMVFSQDLRRESSPDIPLREVEVVCLDTPPMPVVSTTQKIIQREAVVGPAEPSPAPARRKGKAVEYNEDGMPNYSAMTLPQLQNEIKKFGFKSSKSKPAMISLLEECWKAMQNPPAAPASPPPVPSQIVETVDEPIDPSTPTSTILPEVSSPALLLRLHKRMTQIIKSDADKSVYSGILRYEPVVVEDLAEWLIGRDVAVPELVVRGWCDKEGVCCVARESLRNGRRSRY